MFLIWNILHIKHRWLVREKIAYCESCQMNFCKHSIGKLLFNLLHFSLLSKQKNYNLRYATYLSYLWSCCFFHKCKICQKVNHSEEILFPHTKNEQTVEQIEDNIPIQLGEICMQFCWSLLMQQCMVFFFCKFAVFWQKHNRCI